MPEHIKDSKIKVYRTSHSQDEAGGWHTAEHRCIGELWACVRGTDYREHYAMNASWIKPAYNVTVIRPEFEIRIGDHVLYRGRFYSIESVNELGDSIGTDMRFAMQLDPHKLIES